MAGKQKVCGDCKFHLKRGVCPRAEYKDSKLNRAACSSRDSACELFQPKRKRKKKEKIVTKESPGFFKDGFIFEQIANDKYVTGNPQEETAVISIDETTYTPLIKQPWEVASKIVAFAGLDKLRTEIKEYIKEHLFLPEDALYDILTSWVIASWVPEIWNVVPYLFFYGPIATGKTRALEVLAQLGFRAMMSSNITHAALYRVIESWHPTILLDETEIYNQEMKTEVIAILNSGYRRGQWAIRIRNTQEGCVIELFDVFGFKALAGTYSLKKALESRSIILHMIKARVKVRRTVDKKKAVDLRNKLLGWRFDVLAKCDISSISDVFSDIGDSLDFTDGRSLELFTCIVAVSGNDKQTVIEYVKKFTENKTSEEMAGEEAEIIQILSSNGIIGKNNFALTKNIAEKFNLERDEKEQWNHRRIGWLMRKLGFSQRRTGKSRGWTIDKPRLAYWVEIYGNNKPSLEDIPIPLEKRQKRQNDTKSKIDEAFTQLQCFDCRRTLTENTPYTHYEGKPICFTCFNKIEAQKKRHQCKNLIFREDRAFCLWLQSFLAKPEQCSKKCEGWEASK